MKQVLCLTCGMTGKPKKITKGYFFFEILLYFLFIIPGILYTMWRVFSKKEIVCRYCGSGKVMNPDSELAKKLMGVHEVF